MSETDQPAAQPVSRRRELVTTVVDLVAAVLVVAGVAMVCVPAALVVAGLLCAAMSWRATR